MSALSIRLPDSTHQRVKAWAQKDNVSINPFIATAVSEKLAALSTLDYLQERSNQGSREKFLSALSRVPDVAANPNDSWK
jgi:predicted transcriptional regulator